MEDSDNVNYLEIVERKEINRFLKDYMVRYLNSGQTPNIVAF